MSIVRLFARSRPILAGSAELSLYNNTQIFADPNMARPTKIQFDPTSISQNETQKKNKGPRRWSVGPGIPDTRKVLP